MKTHMLIYIATRGYYISNKVVVNLYIHIYIYIYVANEPKC